MSIKICLEKRLLKEAIKRLKKLSNLGIGITNVLTSSPSLNVAWRYLIALLIFRKKELNITYSSANKQCPLFWKEVINFAVICSLMLEVHCSAAAFLYDQRLF